MLISPIKQRLVLWYTAKLWRRPHPQALPGSRKSPMTFSFDMGLLEAKDAATKCF